jgi:hypothetical protein
VRRVPWTVLTLLHYSNVTVCTPTGLFQQVPVMG